MTTDTTIRFEAGQIYSDGEYAFFLCIACDSRTEEEMDVIEESYKAARKMVGLGADATLVKLIRYTKEAQ